MSSSTPDTAAFPAEAPIDQQARFLLGYAVLAPSSHNSQPWRFAVDDGEIRLYADRTRQLTMAGHAGSDAARTPRRPVETVLYGGPN